MFKGQGLPLARLDPALPGLQGRCSAKGGGGREEGGMKSKTGKRGCIGDYTERLTGRRQGEGVLAETQTQVIQCFKVLSFAGDT